jgi:hypothetical protein
MLDIRPADRGELIDRILEIIFIIGKRLPHSRCVTKRNKRCFVFGEIHVFSEF